MKKLPIVNGLWIGNELSAMELLTINSFVDSGYHFNLWVYDDIRNAPASAGLKDANNIIPHSDVFTYSNANKYGHGKGSYAGFSDLFRYKLLYEQGGIWVDMDMTCLSRLEHGENYYFRHHKKMGVVGNYIQCPAKSELMAWCYREAQRSMNASNKDWLLPIKILNKGIEKFNLEKFTRKDTNEDSFPQVSKYLRQGSSIPGEWTLMHWMNEEFRRLNIPKNSCIENSALHKLYDKFSVPIEVSEGKDAAAYLWKTGRTNYILLSLAARLKWYMRKAR